MPRHLETMDATGPENESNKMNMNISISPYNYAFIHSPGNAYTLLTTSQ